MIRKTSNAIVIALLICGTAFGGLQTYESSVTESSVLSTPEQKQIEIEQYLGLNDNTMPGVIELPDIVVTAQQNGND